MTSACTEVQYVDRDELESMTVAQLKILLEENSLSKSGKKSDLIDRLLENSFSIDEEEDFLILEEEDHFDDEIEIPKVSTSTPSDKKIEIMPGKPETIIFFE